jgi:pimeloyl-ACP methyl ester carboxylesterase
VTAETGQADVGGMRISYDRAGHGPAIVLLHGYVGDRRTWGPQLDYLADEYTVVAWDAPGSGRSTDPPESFTLADFADALAAFIDVVGLERPHVVGLSFGGGLALELYHRHPQVPRTLVLAGAYAGWRGSLPDDVVAFRLEQALELSQLPPDQLVDAIVPTLFASSTPAERVDEFAATLREFHPVGFRTMARSFADADLRDVLPGIAVPTLLIYGDQDVRAPLDVAHALHAAIPDSTLVVLPGAGHASNLDDPSGFNRALRTFLRDH